MSYEGYDEHLCEIGHRFITEPYYGFDSTTQEGERVCHAAYDGNPCGRKTAWYNSVDQTNGPSQGEIPESEWDKFIIVPAKTETCSCCGHTELVNDARYRVPTDDEHEAMRVYHYETW